MKTQSKRIKNCCIKWLVKYWTIKSIQNLVNALLMVN